MRWCRRPPWSTAWPANMPRLRPRFAPSLEERFQLRPPFVRQWRWPAAGAIDIDVGELALGGGGIRPFGEDAQAIGDAAIAKPLDGETDVGAVGKAQRAEVAAAGLDDEA